MLPAMAFGNTGRNAIIASMIKHLDRHVSVCSLYIFSFELIRCESSLERSVDDRQRLEQADESAHYYRSYTYVLEIICPESPVIQLCDRNISKTYGVRSILTYEVDRRQYNKPAYYRTCQRHCRDPRSYQESCTQQ